ncbi:MAG: hypothetical protein HY700_08665 [Gemmatimonadetes bacterium]|nr:hypothetical protein [Gemmatimonadota bacterium]
MIRLRLLGDLELLDADGHPITAVLQQPKRLAVLALLASLPGGRVYRRDTLLSLFWPDANQHRARAALRHTLSFLRSHLRGDAIRTAGEEVGITDHAIWCDVAACEAALAEAEWEKALEFYRGHLLDGFHVAGSAGFERWLDETRDRLRRAAAAAAGQLADRAEHAGDLAAAARWSMRSLEIRFDDEARIRRLLTVLDRSGNRAAAIRAYEQFARRLAVELDVTPSPETVRLVSALRAREEPVAVQPLAHRPEERFATPRESNEALDGSTAAKPARGRFGAPRLRVLAAAAGAALLLLAGADAGWRIRRPLAPDLIAVLPFHVTARGPGLRYLREGIVDLLAARFGATTTRPADPRIVIREWRAAGGSEDTEPDREAALRLARGLGAGRLVLGGIVGSSDRLVLVATLIESANGRERGRATAEGPADSLPALIDRLTGQLLARGAGEAEQRMAPLTSASLPALRLYLEGHAAHRRGAYGEAFERFERAVALDSTFALAALNALYATLWLYGGPDLEIDYLVHVAWTNRDRLSERDRILLSAFWPTYPEPGAEADYLAARERAVVAAPDRPEVWFWYGAALFNAGRAMDQANWLPAADSAFRRALALDSMFAPALQRLIEAEIALGDTTAVRALGTLFFARFETAHGAEYLRWRTAVALEDDSVVVALRQRLGEMREDNLYRLIVFAQLDGIALEDADSAAAILVRRARSRAEKARALMLLQGLLLNRGRPQAALAATEALASVQYEDRLHLWLRIGHALYSDGDAAAAAAAARQLDRVVEAPLPSSDPERSQRYQDICWREQWRLRTGRNGSVARAATTMRTLLGREAHCALAVEALHTMAVSGPGLGSIVDRLDSVMRTVPDRVGFPNRIVAQAREQFGDSRGALAALARRLNGNRVLYQLIVLPALATTLREEGRIAASLGDRDRAIRAYRHYLALRSDPEPSLQPQAEEVRRELVRMMATDMHARGR